MKNISKALVGTIAAGAMAMTSAAPAYAGNRDRDRGVDAGDIIAGAIILGGIAAIASASSNRGDRYDNRRSNDRRGYNNNRGNGQRAVERCVRAAERDAQRGGYGYANVTQIRDVDQTRNGWRVKGRIQVESARGYNNRGYSNRGDRYNNRGNNRNDRRGYSSADNGKFTCNISRGRVVGLNYRGIRGL